MMTAREQAEQLRQEAIKTLLDEKAAIDEMLDTLGYDKDVASTKRRGRPPKPANSAVPEVPSNVEGAESQSS